ncbi:hypothetical protein [Ideonella sp. BN130291]|nr:hypothetical protein [Ideonella sp. BN130291]
MPRRPGHNPIRTEFDVNSARIARPRGRHLLNSAGSPADMPKGRQAPL